MDALLSDLTFEGRFCTCPEAARRCVWDETGQVSCTYLPTQHWRFALVRCSSATLSHRRTAERTTPACLSASCVCGRCACGAKTDSIITQSRREMTLNELAVNGPASLTFEAMSRCCGGPHRPPNDTRCEPPGPCVCVCVWGGGGLLSLCGI